MRKSNRDNFVFQIEARTVPTLY